MPSRFAALPPSLLQDIRELADNHRSADLPLAYLITFTCYGTHLRGAAGGSVDRDHNLYRAPYLPACRNRLTANARALSEPKLILIPAHRRSLLASFREVCWHRNWKALAIHVLPTHVHAVIHGLEVPERLMNTLKAYGTRSLKRECHLFRRRYWTERGSKRYLWNADSVEAAARYTAFMQGERGELYLASELSF